MSFRKLIGMPAAQGVAVGVAVFKAASSTSSPGYRGREELSPLACFEQALAESGKELRQIREELANRSPAEAEIFSAHLLILDDPMLQEGVRRRISEDQSPVQAVQDTLSELGEMLAAVQDPYIRERSADLEDVGQRILRHLRGTGREQDEGGGEKAILIAPEIFPSDIAGLDPERCCGFATDRGTATSHAAILARSLGIPGVVGLLEITRQAQEGMTLIVDGRAGVVYLDPDEATLDRYVLQVLPAETISVEKSPVFLADVTRIYVQANIGSVAEAKTALDCGADGIGVVRTEFLFQDRESLPGEEEQLASYREIVEWMEGKPVTIRTLDAGSDKPIRCLSLASEANPALGWRGIRLSLGTPEIFRVQLRAILRASAFGPTHILFPMIATLEEFREAKRFVESTREELSREELATGETGIGAMIEVPAAALMADALAREADFLSIGTNDLVQYVFAADRTNPKTARLADPLQPALLRLISIVFRAGRKRGKKVSVCGEMAADPEAVPILLKLGIREFSMSPVFIPKIKERIKQL